MSLQTICSLSHHNTVHLFKTWWIVFKNAVVHKALQNRAKQSKLKSIVLCLQYECTCWYRSKGLESEGVPESIMTRLAFFPAKTADFVVLASVLELVVLK